MHMLTMTRNTATTLASFTLLMITAFAFAPSTADSRSISGRTGIEKPEALAHFFKALADVESGHRIEPVRIMHFGDSHIAADILTRRIRERLQRQFGDGGAGFILPGNPMSTRRQGVSAGVTSGWTVNGLGARALKNGVYGPLGMVQTTSQPGERMWLQTSGNHFEVYYSRQPGGGNLDIAMDGVSMLDEPIATVSRIPQVGVFSFDSTAGGIHELQIRTLSPGKVTIIGLVAEQLNPGVAYDVLGLNGARANRMLSWNQTALADVLKERSPDLIILSYGTNEVTDGDWSSLSYQRLLAQVLSVLRRSLPETSILIYGPPDRADLPLAANRMSSMNESHRLAAQDHNAAFWSAFEAMGGAGSMSSWVRKGLAQSDRVHLTGAGYARMGDLFLADLMRAYKHVVHPGLD